MTVPSWLSSLRRKHVVEVVNRDRRSVGNLLLGVRRDRIFDEVIGGGQADFDASWVDPRDGAVRLSALDRAMLYAYFNMGGHLAELVAAFEMLFRDSHRLDEPVVLDLGCGPGTGCLAVAHVLGASEPFQYIGVDRASAMLDVGETLARAAGNYGYRLKPSPIWRQTLVDVPWHHPPGWRPVIVIVSYLLASPTLDAAALVERVLGFIDRIGRGPAVVLYTNSTRDAANRKFPEFRDALMRDGFSLLFDSKEGRVEHGSRQRNLRYALFVRQQRRVLELGGR